MLVTAKFDLHPELPNRKPNGLLYMYHESGYIKPCKYLPLNLQMENLLFGTTIIFLIAIVKMFYISQYVLIVTTFILEKLLILSKEYVSTSQM